MLLGLLISRFGRRSLRANGPQRRSAVPCADSVQEALNGLAWRISDDGENALTDPEKLIWNTAVVIAMMTGDGRIGVPSDARISSWGAARAGFRAMGLPALAEFARLFVLELAHRADLDAGDRAADSASLLRIAELKQSFDAVEAEVDFHHELQAMIVRLNGRH
jgi:hypothetical protein